MLVDSETHHLLVSWGQWARGKLKPLGHVKCESIEHKYLPPGENVFKSATELLEGSRPVLSDEPVVKVELLVMRMPEPHRTALRLDYVVYNRMPLSQKCRTLGVDRDSYFDLVARAANRVRLALG